MLNFRSEVSGLSNSFFRDSATVRKSSCSTSRVTDMLIQFRKRTRRQTIQGSAVTWREAEPQPEKNSTMYFEKK